MVSYAEVIQLADFSCPTKLALVPSKVADDDNYRLRLHDYDGPLMITSSSPGSMMMTTKAEDGDEKKVQQCPSAGKLVEKTKSGRRKQLRALKTREEVQSQRMTHIAVERNRRRQMNEHLRVLRSLMPGSYVQRGDQASIIGGAIEFVRELEQLLHRLESQKRRRLLGNGSGEVSRSAVEVPNSLQPAPFYPPDLPFPSGGGVLEEMAENKSSLADVEVRLLGLDAMIKILSRRRPGQLLKTIAALEGLHFSILHANITTVEQTVLYSFNVKIPCEAARTAEDIASSVQQILSSIDAIPA